MMFQLDLIMVVESPVCRNPFDGVPRAYIINGV